MPRVDLLAGTDLSAGADFPSANEDGRVGRGRRRRRRTRVALVVGALGAVVVLAGAVVVSAMVTYGDSADAQREKAALAVTGAEPSSSPSSASPSSASPSPVEPPLSLTAVSPSLSPSPSRSPARRAATAAPEPAPVRPTAAVVVWNNTQIRGLAARSAERVRNVGFTVRGVGNLYGDVDRTTVFYRPGGRAQADLLASRLRGLQAVRPAPSWLPGDAPVILVVKGDFAN
jgi:hypothetical protein